MAVKVLHPSREGGGRDRFAKEATAAGVLHRPATAVVTAIHDAGVIYRDLSPTTCCSAPTARE